MNCLSYIRNNEPSFGLIIVLNNNSYFWLILRDYILLHKYTYINISINEEIIINECCHIIGAGFIFTDCRPE